MNTLEGLLNIQWNGDAGMVKHCLQSSLYVQLGDTFVDVGERKPSIDSTMWYNDETTGPEENFNNFEAYNMRLHAPRKIEDRTSRTDTKLYIAPQYRGDKTNGKLAAIQFENEDRQPSGSREATAAEVKLFNATIEEARKDYKKRLATYWKRYSSKVQARGYWADR